MSNYSGKDFETDFKASFKGTKYENGLMRLYDTTNGFSGCSTPCDFIIYEYPNFYMMELKAVQSTRLDFSKIRPNQVEGLSKWAEDKGVIAGVIVNFYTYGYMYFIDIKLINMLKLMGKKSINMGMCEKYCYQVDGSKRRTRYRINAIKTIEELRTYKCPTMEDLEEDLNGGKI